jgi:transcriptional regulator with XRE-family HTH domain
MAYQRFPDDIAERFGENLRRIRNRCELTQDELARLAQLHRTEVGLLERGQREPRVRTLLKLTSALSVGPDELLDGIRWDSNREKPEDGAFCVGERRIL